MPLPKIINHPDERLVTHIINALNSSPHNIIIKKVTPQTNNIGNNEANKQAKSCAQELHILATVFHHIGHQIPFWPSIPPPHPPHQSNTTGSIHNLKTLHRTTYFGTHLGSPMHNLHVPKCRYGYYFSNYH
jgi:hypothetical protein